MDEFKIIQFVIHKSFGQHFFLLSENRKSNVTPRHFHSSVKKVPTTNVYHPLGKPLARPLSPPSRTSQSKMSLFERCGSTNPSFQPPKKKDFISSDDYWPSANQDVRPPSRGGGAIFLFSGQMPREKFSLERCRYYRWRVLINGIAGKMERSLAWKH
ncbi:hypothetical protein CDAR_572011 [Caerostris darwini]|uniref:Uncharacterized protein n=1 Tax=Caerostris darwini TaxID=1538125 RepID=A0AAV4MW45_9ARAC|nr:hypothetical protein CDAR_572011 [Caerostris darwini]